MINILPEKQKKIIRHEYWLRLASTIMIMIAFLSISATILILPAYFFSRSKEFLIENRLEAFNNSNPDIKIEDINKTTKDINTKLAILDSKWPGSVYLGDIFKILLGLIPNKIKVSQFLYSENMEGALTFQIYGRAQDRETLKTFKTVLENNGHFKDVNLPISNFIEKSNIDFTVSFSFNTPN